MEKDLAATHMALSEVEVRVTKVEEVLDEARNQALAMKEEAWMVEAQASKAAM